ncbi:type II toxin-antitoxin system RelE/ParE family toxin [Serratia fonticola]|uniref:type II toxin-antitoxin system RelE/ParE family toxin n=1 Tax=Serratia fonticola TaxID=47917 RepID=UPI0034C6CB3F
MYQSKYYQDENGRQPFNEWRQKLKKKDPRAVSKVDNSVDRAEAGNFGDHKFERDGVWEMRINYGPGYRVYYSVEAGEIILLLIGGTKQSQDGDLDKAVSYLQDYKARSKNDSD